MAQGSRQLDDLDFLLGALLREETAAQPSSTRVWAAIRTRISAGTVRPHRRIVLGTHSYLAPMEWTLDWHLMSMARIVR